MTTAKQNSYDVIVVGLGPVGALTTLLLSRQGLKVAAVERDQEVYKLPRAVNLDGEIVRALQPLGLAQELADLLQTTRPGERAGFADSKHNWLFGQELNSVGPCGWQSMNMFDQPEVEQYLRDQALNHTNVDSFIGFTAQRVQQNPDQVTVAVTDNTTDLSLCGTYLVACDGAASTIRKALDIVWVNLGYDQDWLVVDVETKPGHTLGTTTMQVCDPKRITTYVCTKEPYRRWEFKLNDGETWEEMLAPETIHALLDEWTPRETYRIRRAAMYQFHAATAQSWASGANSNCGRCRPPDTAISGSRDEHWHARRDQSRLEVTHGNSRRCPRQFTGHL